MDPGVEDYARGCLKVVNSKKKGRMVRFLLLSFLFLPSSFIFFLFLFFFLFFSFLSFPFSFSFYSLLLPDR